MFKLSVEHIALFILAAFLLYHLTRSCGCANSIDGFSLSGEGTIMPPINASCQKAYNNCICNISDSLGWVTQAGYNRCIDEVDLDPVCAGDYFFPYDINDVCKWDGEAPFCDGNCSSLKGNWKKVKKSNCGDGDCCWSGYKVKCVKTD